MRRVTSIAMVHETLSMSVDERVDLDDLVDKVIPMMSDVAVTETQVVVRRDGQFGVVPAELATPLVMVLTELVQNAFEHAYTAGQRGEVVVQAERSAKWLDVVISDDGRGLPPGFSLERTERLGLQIVRTLVESELRGSLSLRRRQRGGTEAVLRVPLQRPPLGLPLDCLVHTGRSASAALSVVIELQSAETRLQGGEDSSGGCAREPDTWHGVGPFFCCSVARAGCLVQALLRARVRALRRLRARRSSSLIPPQTPASWPLSSAHARQSETTGQRRQTVFASAICRSAGPLFPTGKNSSGSSSRQIARWRQSIGTTPQLGALMGTPVVSGRFGVLVNAFTNSWDVKGLALTR